MTVSQFMLCGTCTVCYIITSVYKFGNNRSRVLAICRQKGLKIHIKREINLYDEIRTIFTVFVYFTSAISHWHILICQITQTLTSQVMSSLSLSSTPAGSSSNVNQTRHCCCWQYWTEMSTTPRERANMFIAVFGWNFANDWYIWSHRHQIYMY